MAWTLTYDAKAWTINTERNWHYHERARVVKEWRMVFMVLARNAKIPPLEAIHVEARVWQAKYKLCDVGANFPTVKAAVDGIVDARVIPEDNPKHMKSLTFWAPERGPDRLMITITEAI